MLSAGIYSTYSCSKLFSTVRFEQCNGESFSVSNRASLKILAFAASDSPKSSIKIAYPERNTMEKKPMVTPKLPLMNLLFES